MTPRPVTIAQVIEIIRPRADTEPDASIRSQIVAMLEMIPPPPSWPHLTPEGHLYERPFTYRDLCGLHDTAAQAYAEGWDQAECPPEPTWEMLGVAHTEVARLKKAVGEQTASAARWRNRASSQRSKAARARARLAELGSEVRRPSPARFVSLHVREVDGRLRVTAENDTHGEQVQAIDFDLPPAAAWHRDRPEPHISRVTFHQGRDTEAILARTRVVAESWRDAMMAADEPLVNLGAHPLACVLGALDGETDPSACGLSPGPISDAFLSAAPADQPARRLIEAEGGWWDNQWPGVVMIRTDQCPDPDRYEPLYRYVDGALADQPETGEVEAAHERVARGAGPGHPPRSNPWPAPAADDTGRETAGKEDRLAVVADAVRERRQLRLRVFDLDEFLDRAATELKGPEFQQVRTMSFDAPVPAAAAPTCRHGNKAPTVICDQDCVEATAAAAPTDEVDWDDTPERALLRRIAAIFRKAQRGEGDFDGGWMTRSIEAAEAMLADPMFNPFPPVPAAAAPGALAAEWEAEAAELRRDGIGPSSGREALTLEACAEELRRAPAAAPTPADVSPGQPAPETVTRSSSAASADGPETPAHTCQKGLIGSAYRCPACKLRPNALGMTDVEKLRQAITGTGPTQMVTIKPTARFNLDDETYPHHDVDGDPMGWAAITYRWLGDGYAGGAPDHWTWELVSPASDGVVLDGTATDDPAPFLSKLVDLLQVAEA